MAGAVRDHRRLDRQRGQPVAAVGGRGRTGDGNDHPLPSKAGFLQSHEAVRLIDEALRRSRRVEAREGGIVKIIAEISRERGRSSTGLRC